MKTVEEINAKELAKEVLYDLQIACFKNQIVDTIFHYPVPLTTLYDYLICRTGITQKEFDDLTEKAMQECGLLEDSEDVENN